MSVFNKISTLTTIISAPGDNRVTEQADNRLTEQGDNRVTE